MLKFVKDIDSWLIFFGQFYLSMLNEFNYVINGQNKCPENMPVI